MLQSRPWLLLTALLFVPSSLANPHAQAGLTVQDPSQSFDASVLPIQTTSTSTQDSLYQDDDHLQQTISTGSAAATVEVPVAKAMNSATFQLWYRTPADPTKKNTRRFLIGNGKMQVLVSGGVNSERLQLNDPSLWTGGPNAREDYHGGNPADDEQAALKHQAIQSIQKALEEKKKVGISYPTIKDILGTEEGFGHQKAFGHIVVEELNPFERVHSYRRELDLAQGVARVTFSIGNVNYTREHFCSFPDSVCVMRIQASEPKSVNIKVSLDASYEGNFTNVHNRLGFQGRLSSNNMSIETQVAVKTEGATGISMSNNRQVIAMNFDAITLYYAFGTGWTPSGYPTFTNVDPHDRLVSVIDKALGAWYNDQYIKHTKDHDSLFSGFQLDLGQAPGDLATDELLKNIFNKTASDQDQSYFDALLFQLGRYSLIASSRPGSLPMNGQSIWTGLDNDDGNDDDDNDDDPKSDPIGPNPQYKMNVNLQMNYWLAESTNLGDTVVPLIDYMEQLLVPRGQGTAAMLYQARGWTAHTYSNIWAHTGPTSSAKSSYFPTAAAWLCQHAWDHYLYSQDYYFLRDHAYKLMKGAAQFWLDTLVPSPVDGTLVSSPSYSPEHGPYAAGASLDQQLIHQLFKSTLDAIAIVGERDKAFVQNLTLTLEKLSTGLEVGKGEYGQLKEWKEDMDDPNERHYHLAQFYALYPGHQLLSQEDETTKKTLMEAARKTLDGRGAGTAGVTFGWPKVWRAALWARLGDGARVTEQLALFQKENILEKGLLSFEEQTGIMGYSAALVESLIQSPVPGLVNIFPCALDNQQHAHGLPERWLVRGGVEDYRTREGHKVSFSWQEGKVQLVECVAVAASGTTVFHIGTKGDRHAKVFVRGSTKEVAATIDGDTVSFALTKGQAYVIQLDS